MKYSLPLHALAFIAIVALSPYLNAKQDGGIDAKKEALLSYLKSVAESDKYLSGQRWNASDWEKLKEKTGKTPAIICVEYCISEGNRKLGKNEKPIQWEKINPIIKKHWDTGGIVRITCHFPSPYNESYGGLRTKLGDDAAKLLSNEDSPEKMRWLKMLDDAAEGVKNLNDLGVVPIFGPMHEMNGKWFWWGASLSPKSQRALWDQIYSALEKKGCRAVWLNALSPNIPIDVENGPDFDKMDIIGCDVYGYKSAKNLKVVDEKYKLAKAKGKLFTVSEFGAYSAHNPRRDKEFGTYDLAELPTLLDKHCPRAYGIVFWSGPWGIHESLNSEKFMNNPKILTHGQVEYVGK